MKKLLGFIIVVSCIAAFASVAVAANTATVSYAVSAINEISVSGDPAAMTVIAATAGSQPDAVSDVSTTYGITTNETKKITAAIDTDMPAGVTLTVELAAPTGGTSAGAVSLSTVAADVVTGVDKVAESGKLITYGLSATAAAGVVATANKTVTLTIAAP